jgi:hypothetical protein
MAEGEEGPAVAKAMELLIAIGEVFEAPRLIPVESAHISGVSYRNLGEAGAQWLEELAELGGRARLKATLNPAGMDIERWREMGIPEDFAIGQKGILGSFHKMGVKLTCTCIPYLIGHRPEFGSQVAWGESNAVCFSNSVCGARTNRESGPTSLASAITGLTPLYGYRLDEERRPGKIIDIEPDLQDPLDYSALGYLTGRMLGRTIPYFKGLNKPSVEATKTLGAACATSGSIALWHGEGVTPEAEKFSHHLNGLEVIHVEKDDLDEEKERFHGEIEGSTICIGCPHCSLKEIGDISKKVKGLELEGRLLVFTNQEIYRRGIEAGFIDIIEKAGGLVYRDTCMVVAPLKEMGLEAITTNSFKGAHYSLAHGFETHLASLEEILMEVKQ